MNQASKNKSQCFFHVGDGHEIYYELFGNPSGQKIVYVHGGPGAGCSIRDRRFFDPERHYVLFHDQRGAGQSRPFCSLENNTTESLCADLATLMDHVNFERAIFFGGSWGSTLSLVFAERYPKRVERLILRGIFLARRRDIDYYVNGGTELFAPSAWNRFLDPVPAQYRQNPACWYYEQMRHGSPEEQSRAAAEWARYEVMIGCLDPDPAAAAAYVQQPSHRSLAMIEAHFMVNSCFLPENYILQNAGTLRDIPTSIVQGAYDLICPPEGAWSLARALPLATVNFVRAGHSSMDPEINRHLMRELSPSDKSP